MFNPAISNEAFITLYGQPVTSDAIWDDVIDARWGTQLQAMSDIERAGFVDVVHVLAQADCVDDIRVGLSGASQTTRSVHTRLLKSGALALA